MKKIREGHLVYHDMLDINIELTNGYFSSNSIESLLHPYHNCGIMLSPAPLRSAFQGAIDSIDNYWAKGTNIVNPDELNFEETCYCKRKLQIRCKLSVILPKNCKYPFKVAQIYDTWKRRVM